MGIQAFASLAGRGRRRSGREAASIDIVTRPASGFYGWQLRNLALRSSKAVGGTKLNQAKLIQARLCDLLPAQYSRA
jgi:hypothetical protein